MSDYVLSHGPGKPLLLRDKAHSLDRQQLLAHIRSGDYFITLATLLDAVSDTLTPENDAEAAILQHIIEDLLFLDKNYQMIKK